MEKIISYEEIPFSNGENIYLRNETDPKLYVSLLLKGYKVIKNISDADEKTIYVTGRRQDYLCKTYEEYRNKVINSIDNSFMNNDIIRPNTLSFSYDDLFNYKYKIPFVLKNENQNGGREKFLINNEEDYENLIKACKVLLNKKIIDFNFLKLNDIRFKVDYNRYLTENFTVQEYINTPSEFNTTVRILTTSFNDLLYASLKYNKKEDYIDKTSLLGYLLWKVYPLSTKSIVSNTLSGGKNILLGENNYIKEEKILLDKHNINSNKFNELLEVSKKIHNEYRKELGIICGFDYIYDMEREKWFLLEYHSRPMVGDYSKRQGISYVTKEDRLRAEGRVRATSLKLALKKN